MAEEESVEEMERRLQELKEQSYHIHKQIKKAKTEKKHHERKKRSGEVQSIFDVQVSVKTILIFVIGVLIIVSIFLLGKYTTSSMTGIEGQVTLDTAQGIATPAQAAAQATLQATPTPEDQTAQPTPEPTQTPEATPTPEETSTPEATPTPAPATDGEETIVTSYTGKAKIEFVGNPQIEKAEYAGKVWLVKYKITNNEEGTIKPRYVAVVEDDGVSNYVHKRYRLPDSLQKVKKGTSVTYTLSGQLDTRVNADNPGAILTFDKSITKVKLRIGLLDANNKLIADETKDFPVS